MADVCDFTVADRNTDMRHLTSWAAWNDLHKLQTTAELLLSRGRGCGNIFSVSLWTSSPDTGSVHVITPASNEGGQQNPLHTGDQPRSISAPPPTPPLYSHSWSPLIFFFPMQLLFLLLVSLCFLTLNLNEERLMSINSLPLVRLTRSGAVWHPSGLHNHWSAFIFGLQLWSQTHKLRVTCCIPFLPLSPPLNLSFVLPTI